ncbi:PhzF family phenazine biosynthesis protein [Halobacteria archaeon AArc-dxtr1]|nr:PhzF family phenazine biosynthesis protein [Halobacteria archaeon AArc-dxtr1]
MQPIRVRQVDAFADEPLAGNPAGVVPDADGLSADQMQAIASELAVSETAFVRESDVADRRLRYFTPTTEVDCCGHATIGTFAHLHEAGEVAGTTTVETNAGVLDVEVDPDGTVWMSQDEPTIREVDIDYDRVAESLGVDRTALRGPSADLPLAVASTGLPFLLVPITYLSDVGGAEPDLAAIETLAEAVDAAGIYLFTFDTLAGDATLHGRTFVPGAGVPEDPVTGTASGAVGAYLKQYEAFDPFPQECRVEQGHYVDRPGTVRVQIDDPVRIGGTGVTSLTGTLSVPEAPDDDIIEV